MGGMHSLKSKVEWLPCDSYMINLEIDQFNHSSIHQENVHEQEICMNGSTKQLFTSCRRRIVLAFRRGGEHEEDEVDVAEYGELPGLLEDPRAALTYLPTAGVVQLLDLELHPPHVGESLKATAFTKL